MFVKKDGQLLKPRKTNLLLLLKIRISQRFRRILKIDLLILAHKQYLLSNVV
jgi:hypothetical protein